MQGTMKHLGHFQNLSALILIPWFLVPWCHTFCYYIAPPQPCQELEFSEEYVSRILYLVSCNCMKFSMSKGEAIDNDREEAIEAAGAQAKISEYSWLYSKIL